MSFNRGCAGSRRPARLFACLLLSTFAATFISGCGSSRSSSRERLGAAKEVQAPAAQNPEVVVYADDAMLRKPYALIGGTIENTSGSKLEGVSVELELQRRSDGSKEKRSVQVNPQDLAPGQRGSYSLKILSEEWSDSRIVSLRSESRPGEIGFKTLPGARRPPERLAEPSPVTRVVQGPKPKKRGDDDFINTPDNPVSVP